MHIKTIEMFADYKIELPPACSAYKRKVASKATLARLERALSSGDGSVTRQVQVYVSFSSMNGHAAHTFGMALAYWQPMNPEVSAKINMLVQQGTSSVSQVQKCVQFYVEHVLFAGKPNPPPSCRAFYPTREDIRSHIQSCIRKDRYSSVDQVNAGRGKIALCDFHREQAWDQWLRKKENGTDRDQALLYLRQLARAHTAEEVAAAVTQMKGSDLWATSPAFQSYVEGHWLTVSAMWATCFRPGLCVTTNNGTEAQNKMLKEHYLKWESGRRSLTGLIRTLRTFLSDREQHFHKENLKVSSDYRHYHDAVPEYLHNRPRSVVLHIMSRLAAADDIDQTSVTPGPCQGTFHVKSSSSEEVSHCVDFAEPSCTCHDFRKHKLPCKHFCAIFLSDKDWGIDNLPEGYRNGPLMALDDHVMAESHGSEEHDTGDASSNYIETAITNETFESVPDLERSSSSGVGTIKSKVLREFDKAKNLAYYCTDSKILENVLEKLQECSAQLQLGTRANEGLNLRGSPTKGCSGTKRRHSHHKEPDDVSELKRSTPASKEHWRSKGRVGSKAEMLRKTYNKAA
ncbi:hypothetical protein MRX96_000091 [Rhipicephalus microplus]